jgi:hypothetical protein
MTLLAGDVNAPEILHAMVELLSRSPDNGSSVVSSDLGRIYRLTSSLPFDDVLDERQELLARIAFLAWNQARLLLDHPEACKWRDRCRRHALAQDHVRHFFSLPFAARSSSLRDRFLSDEVVLLLYCEELELARNRVPLDVAREARLLYDWLAENGRSHSVSTNQAHFFSAWIASSLVVSEHHLRSDGAVHEWIGRAQQHISLCAGAPTLEAQLDQIRITMRYDNYEISPELVEACGALVRRFETLGMADGAARARQLGAVILKELGEDDRALEWAMVAHDLARACGELCVASLSLGVCAQILGLRGQFAEAMRLGRESLKYGEQSGSCWVVAEAVGSVAEVLRDHGNLRGAIEGYRAAIDSYEALAMRAQAAYLRVILAEALVIAGLHTEGTAEILRALPVIEEHHLTREALAAVGILREAIRRQESDPDALGELRHQLQLMREQGKL